MDIKFNLSILKNKEVIFHMYIKKKEYTYGGTIKAVKNKKGNYTFIFEDNSKIQTTDSVLLKCKVRRINNIIHIYENIDTNIISGIAGFSMNDTYGFPIEITQEILQEDGYELDIEGCNVLKELQKEMSNGTYVNKDGWKNK